MDCCYPSDLPYLVLFLDNNFLAHDNSNNSLKLLDLIIVLTVSLQNNEENVLAVR